MGFDELPNPDHLDSLILPTFIGAISFGTRQQRLVGCRRDSNYISAQASALCDGMIGRTAHTAKGISYHAVKNRFGPVADLKSNVAVKLIRMLVADAYIENIYHFIIPPRAIQILKGMIYTIDDRMM